MAKLKLNPVASFSGNISSEFEEASLKNSLYEPYDIMGNPIQLATPPNFLFDKDQILTSLGLKNNNFII